MGQIEKWQVHTPRTYSQVRGSIKYIVTDSEGAFELGHLIRKKSHECDNLFMLSLFSLLSCYLL